MKKVDENFKEIAESYDRDSMEFKNLESQGSCYQFTSRMLIIYTDRLIFIEMSDGGENLFSQYVYEKDKPSEYIRRWKRKLEKDDELISEPDFDSDYASLLKIKRSNNANTWSINIPTSSLNDFIEWLGYVADNIENEKKKKDVINSL